MRLTVLGCSGTFPGPESPCSSYLLESDGFRLLVDAGNGAIGMLQRHVGLLDLDAVLISHVHADHYLDLIPYTYARRYHPAAPVAPLPVYGPRALLGRLGSAFGRPVAELLATVYDLRRATSGQRLQVGPFAVELARLNHPVETLGMRISADDRVLAYSADTGESDALAGLARDADLFLCEASFLDGQDNPAGVHLTGRQAGQHAARAGVGRLLVTHLVPWGDAEATLAEAMRAYPGSVELARTSAATEV